MTKPSFLRGSVLFLGCLAFSALPALAQHGGGGGGHAGGGAGAHASGGAAHAGGGGFSGGGGVRSAGAAPRSSGGGNFYRQPSSVPNRVNPNYANPGNAAYGRGAQPAPNAYRSNPGAVNAQRDGQWHSFGNTGGNGSTSTVGNAGNSGQPNSGWQSNGGPTRGGAPANAGADVRPAGDAGIRSFAGEGHNIVETTRPAVAAPNFAAARLGFAAPGITSAHLGGSPALFAGAAFPARSNFAFNAGFGFRSGGFGFNRFGFRNGFGFRRFGFRSPFFGIGWPFWGFGASFVNSCPYGPGWYDAGYGFGYGYDPFWYNAAPCTGLWGVGYGPWDVYSTPAPYYYPDDEQYGPAPPDQDNPQYQQYQPQDQGTPPLGEVYNAPASNGPDINEPTEAQRNAMKPVQLYLKSGGVFEATIYWIANGKLNYVTDNGAVITVDIDQLDLQRTISENARRGVPFTLAVQGNDVPPQSQPAPAPPSQ